MSLADAVADPARREAATKDAMAELEAELDGRSGLSAMAIKAAYKSVVRIRPGFIESNLGRLLPRFAPVLDVHREAAGADIDGYFSANSRRIADDLLAVTDARAAEANNKVAKSVYEKLRPKAADQVVDGMPRLANLVSKHGG